MSYLSHLKRNEMDIDIRWIVKYDSDNNIKEVKQIFNPEEYINTADPRILYNKEDLIKLLEDERKK